ncbi:hypothetical protein JTB14_024852 [Gonioctena quinquepunctata]|nr:hypothetical protein JTB14_024852 [Gonioctena quinquepunctata]
MRKQNLLTSLQADILSEVRTLKESIKELDISKRSDSTSLPEYDKLALPAKKIEVIGEIENYLTIPENFPKVVEEMSKVGGNSPFDFIKRVLLQLMTYEVAAYYTWHGTEGKLPFKKTRICQMIMSDYFPLIFHNSLNLIMC